MLRATRVLPAGSWAHQPPIDEIALDFDARHRRRYRYTAAGGTDFLLDLPRARVLADGDGLLLEEGGIIAVHAAPEPLIEVTADTPQALLRLAWHLGNRHLPACIEADCVRIREDHVIAEMLRGLGARLSRVVAPFDPERGAYHAEHPHPHRHKDGNKRQGSDTATAGHAPATDEARP